MAKKLKLFVWEDVLRDYTAGLAVALAPDVETARKMLEEKIGWGFLPNDLKQEPKIISEPSAFYVHGGS